MNKRISLILAMTILCFVISGCGLFSQKSVATTAPRNENLRIQDALAYYVSYMETWKVDHEKALREFSHYNSQEALEVGLDHPEELVSYEVLRIEQLSDQLWVVEVFGITSTVKNGMYAANYVGLINGEYRVMISEEHIPQSLKEGVEIEPYIPHGPDIVHPDDVLH